MAEQKMIEWWFPLSFGPAKALADSRVLEPFRDGGVRFGVWVLGGAIAGEGVDLDGKTQRIAAAVDALQDQGVLTGVGGFAWQEKDDPRVQLDRDRWQEFAVACAEISAAFPGLDFVVDLEPQWAEPRYIGHTSDQAWTQIGAMAPFLDWSGNYHILQPDQTLYIMPGRFRHLMCTAIDARGGVGWLEEYTYRIGDTADWSIYPTVAAAYAAYPAPWVPGFKLSGMTAAFVTQMLRYCIRRAWFTGGSNLEQWLKGAK
ncbi:MAG TPA: hypothetical protein VM223_05410 [Planctomycetota bacterium]|nr:hypothetical protein [Planctomycetota bacterium]